MLRGQEEEEGPMTTTTTNSYHALLVFRLEEALHLYRHPVTTRFVLENSDDLWLSVRVMVI